MLLIYAILSQARLKITVTTALIWQRKLYDRMSMVAKCATKKIILSRRQIIKIVIYFV